MKANGAMETDRDGTAEAAGTGRTGRGRASPARALLALCAALAPLAPRAATDSMATTVERLLASAEGFGGCMAMLGTSPSSAGLDCPAGRWVTFSCTGKHASKGDAMRMYDAAQLAFATGRPVRVWVDDSRKHGGHCFAWRVDVLGGPGPNPSADAPASADDPDDPAAAP